MPFTLGIIVPTYNESENIKILIEQIKDVVETQQIPTLLLVMDDSSPDGTGDIVTMCKDTLKSKFLTIKLHTRSGKLGLASAYTQGITMIKDECEFVQTMDADLSHNPIYLPKLLSKAKEGHDLVIGSRNITDGGVQGWGWFRNAVSKLGSLYSRILLRTNVYDFTGGFNLYNTHIFKDFDVTQVKAEGYLFQIEMKYTITKKGFSFAEVPIIFKDRERGKSKFNANIILEAWLGVIQLALK